MGKVYILDNTESLLGRSLKADLSIEDPRVSRKHAVLNPEGRSFSIRDLNSKNGLFVNYKKVKEDRLEDGDKILVGSTTMKFLLSDNLEIAFHQELYDLASKDGLTEVLNKKVFEEILLKEMSRAIRHKVPLSLAMFDIDHFKKFNDLLGHHTGDFVLKEIASVIRENMRKEDTLARYGGEEFIVLLPDTELDRAFSVAEKIRTIIGDHVFEFEEMPIRITVSGGVTQLDESFSPEELIVRVDEKLYEAKQSGRNRVYK